MVRPMEIAERSKAFIEAAERVSSLAKIPVWAPSERLLLELIAEDLREMAND